jgi:hypothetical protein
MEKVKGGKYYGIFYYSPVGLKCWEHHVVPIGFVLINYLLQHGFEDFVDSLKLAIWLQIVWGSESIGESKEEG